MSERSEIVRPTSDRASATEPDATEPDATEPGASEPGADGVWGPRPQEGSGA